MKFVIQKGTGLDETTVVEMDLADPRADSPKIEAAYAAIDRRLAQTNQKIIEVREFIQEIKDPNYRYLFTSFMDQFLGISSQAESLAQKFKVDPPMHFDEWLRKKNAGAEDQRTIRALKDPA